MALRVSMRFSYEPSSGYDFPSHWAVVEWMIEHREVARPELLFQAQHPPLFYTIAAVLFANGVSLPNITWLPITCGVLRLGLTWAAIELYLPHSRWARASALALAATLAASVHVDGMIYTECINALLASAAMLLAPLAFRSSLRRRAGLAVLIGLLLGAEMLTKISALAVVLALCGVAALEFLASKADLRARGKALACWGCMLATCLAVSGWYFARNVADYGRPFVTTFDLAHERGRVKHTNELPYLQRRTLGYVFGWEPLIYSFPFVPSCTRPHATFFPIVVTSAFIDYWGYDFSGVIGPGKTGVWHPAAWTPREVLLSAKRAAVGATIIFLATVAAWLAAARRVWWRRDWGRMSLLAVPLIMLAASLHFAITYPADSVGVAKGVYMQYAAGPLCGLYGVGVGWCREREGRWPLLAVLLGALWLVAGYTLYCRLRVPLLPL